ncbi:MAG: DOPA 4,5-dioxygenase [Methylophilaceae bacterium 17-44-8]|jgi:DOPA 4,5-dioxygenase|nr:MAG: DOPA 4,5-dioxygenase [Methylophilales bacterium 28-44-11]OZA05404.1 MAG: DOPA 4,5-dioxygenase [Methylophilaceae bacterium 17-44-8]
MQMTNNPLNTLYHAHIYFNNEQSALATQVREQIIHDIPQLTYRGQLIPMSIGPHPKPMFELHIPGDCINFAMASIDTLREGLSVLIHPVNDNEYLAHTQHAKWLGVALPLKIEVLK